ncbi:hypothetical protein OEZ85_012445 [Tetradesmus obliquus]|uniref:C3H1-type domain-containing protein n=1 Tax=Tetradesmus obliquus TaxID=3088 RepID=A0ABY8TTF2_TETOB|nr:hypothetical protein OEZ85_012445 [Tetradesmus obliquus]
MPHVRKADVLGVVRQLWSTGTIEDEAKLILAEQLINETWEGKKSGIPMNQAGVPVKAALGERWLGAKERMAQGKPPLGVFLAEDPYFILKDMGGSHLHVQLRVSRLAQLIGNAELISQYRNSASSSGPGSSSSSSSTSAAGSSSSSSSAAAGGRQGRVQMNSEGLPLRPGVAPCQHYLKHGWCIFKHDCWYNHPERRSWCIFKHDCWYNHPERPGKRKATATSPAASLQQRTFFTESHLEPGVMLRNGVNPVRPGVRPCQHYLRQGWCVFKAKCRNDHPDLTDAAGSSSSSSAARAAAASPQPQDGPAESLVRQPPQQLLLGLLIDSLWPPRASKDNYVKGQIARHIIVTLATPGDVTQENKTFDIGGAGVGNFVNRWWPSQSLYDPAASKPYASLKALLGGDPYFRVWMAGNVPMVTLMYGKLIDNGGDAAAERLEAMADAVWLPTAGKEVWLCGCLAKWLLNAGFKGHNEGRKVLPRVLAEGPEQPTVFCMDMAQAGEYLLRCWRHEPHPYDAESAPWSQLKPLIAGDRFLYIEPNPRGRGVVSPAGGGPADVASAAADLAALEAMHYEPPDNMQWWWPEHKPEKHDCCWTEIAIRLLDPAAEEFELQLAEMVQHLEISAVLGMACATYKSHPHLLQFFAPHAAIGGLEMPSAVYLLDVMRPGRRIAEVLDLVRPVLASQQNTKVCHGSKLWSGQLEKAYNIRLVNYFDTQQAHHVYNVLRHEAGRSPHLNGAALKATAEVSLSALLRTHDLYHPVRHTESGKEAVKLWQDRPLSAELVTCAAADVAYLIPLMELQLRQLRIAAGEVRQQQQQQRPGSRAAALLSSLPPELSEPTTLAAIAAGAEAAGRGGGLSYDRLRAIGGLEAFHQAPLHALGLQLGQSYGAVRGRPMH